MINNMTKKEIEKLLENDVFKFEVYTFFRFNNNEHSSYELIYSGGKNLSLENLINTSWDLYNLIKYKIDIIFIKYNKAFSSHMFIWNKNIYLVEQSIYKDFLPIKKDLIVEFTNADIYRINFDWNAKNIEEIENLLKMDYIKTL